MDNVDIEKIKAILHDLTAQINYLDYFGSVEAKTAKMEIEDIKKILKKYE